MNKTITTVREYDAENNLVKETITERIVETTFVNPIVPVCTKPHYPKWQPSVYFNSTSGTNFSNALARN